MIDQIQNALSAYGAAARQGDKPGMEARIDDKSFAEVLADTASDARSTLQTSEAMSMSAISGETNLTDVVMAVTNAEATLQTVIAVRDKIVAAYQEIMRMPV